MCPTKHESIRHTVRRCVSRHDGQRKENDEPPVPVAAESMLEAALDVERREVVAVGVGEEGGPGPPAGRGDEEGDADDKGLVVGVQDSAKAVSAVSPRV